MKQRPKARLQIEALHLQLVLTHRGVFMMAAEWMQIESTSQRACLLGRQSDPLHIFVFFIIPSSRSMFVHLSKYCNQPAARL